MLQLRRASPAALGDLVDQFVDRKLHLTSAPFSACIDATLDLMDDTTYDRTVRRAWQMTRQGDVSTACVWESALLQQPDIFADDWELLLRITTGELSNEVLHAWRALEMQVTQTQQQHALENLDRNRAIAALFSRCSPLVQVIWRQLFPDPSDMQTQAWLTEAGYAAEENGLRVLHNDTPFHIHFAPAQWRLMLFELPGWKREIWRTHPTWNPAAPPALHARMGGTTSATCSNCHAPLHRLLCLAEPRHVGIDSDTALEFATCLSCQGWEVDALFYRHNNLGQAQPHPSQIQETAQVPEFLAPQLLEAEIGLFAAPARWVQQDWGASNNRQNLNRIGGAPSWVQSARYPGCPDCQRSMHFVMQLDSNLPQEDGGEWLWGSGGMNYTFWCRDCRVSAHVWQCT